MPLVQQLAAMAHVEVAHLALDAARIGAATAAGMALKEQGPSGDACNKVDGSEGKEKQIMNFLRRNQNTFVWIPGINDCHSAVERAIGANGLQSPGIPGGRLGSP